MTKIDIKESEGGGASSSKSPSPARREAGIPAPKDTSQTAPKAAKEENTSALRNDSSSSRLAPQTLPLCNDKNREGVSNESGYFEDEEEAGTGAGGQREDSIEIIFDKNASNNNSGQSASQSGRKPFWFYSLDKTRKSQPVVLQ